MEPLRRPLKRHGGGNLMETMERHVTEMETQLLRWGAMLDELVAKADEDAAVAKLDYHRRVDALKAKYRVAQTKLDALKTAESSEASEVMQEGVENTWNELEVAFDELSENQLTMK
jgi:hypothetical protein